MNNQLDLFGFEETPKKVVKKPKVKPREEKPQNVDNLIEKALNRLKSQNINETEQVIRDWVNSDWHHGLNPDYHVAAYNIALLKILKVDNETIIKHLLCFL